MNLYEAERAFWEKLDCETIRTDLTTREQRKLGKPVEIAIERNKDGHVMAFLVFASGEKSISKYQIDLLQISGQKGE